MTIIFILNRKFMNCEIEQLNWTLHIKCYWGSLPFSIMIYPLLEPLPFLLNPKSDDQSVSQALPSHKNTEFNPEVIYMCSCTQLEIPDLWNTRRLEHPTSKTTTLWNTRLLKHPNISTTNSLLWKAIFPKSITKCIAINCYEYFIGPTTNQLVQV